MYNKAIIEKASQLRNQSALLLESLAAFQNALTKMESDLKNLSHEVEAARENFQKLTGNDVERGLVVYLNQDKLTSIAS